MLGRADGCWRWPRSTMAARGPGRRGSAGSACRRCGTGGRFNAHGPEGLVDGKAPGNVCKLSARHREALLALVESGPIPAVHGVVRWRLKDLVQWLWDEFR